MTVTLYVSTLNRRQSKTLLHLTYVDQNVFETLLLITICRRLSACLVINQFTINNFAAIFDCMPVDRASNSNGWPRHKLVGA